jgi:PKD repeat protein
MSIISITLQAQCINVPITDTNWGSWQRSSNIDGWTITNNDYSFPATQRTIVTTSGHLGFGVGATDYDSDPNFGTEGGAHLGIRPPSGTGISNIIRVGRKLNLNDNTAIPNGNACFVTLTFTPTASNSKFRIYYIGMGESSFNNGPTPNPIAATNFNSTTHGYGNTYEEPRFGVVCKYDYTAPFSNVSPNPRSNIGMNEFGISSPTGFNGTTPTGFSLPPISNLVGSQSYDYGANDLFAGMQAGNPAVNPSNNGSSPSDFQPISGHTTFRKMSNWKYYDLDFSEFVGINSDPLHPNTITITLFSHSSKASSSKRSAYAYYAFECLGGNIPATTQINYHIADQSFGCKPSTEILSLNSINTPLPPATWISYVANENEELKWLSTPDAQGLNGYWNAGQPAAVEYPNHFASIRFQLKNSAGIFQPYRRIYSVPGYDKILINVLPSEITGIYNNPINPSDPNNGRNFYRFKAIYTTMSLPAYETEFNVFVDFQSQPPPCTDTLTNGTKITNEKEGLYCSGNYNHTINIDSSCLLVNPNIKNITYQWQWYDENYGTYNDIPAAVGAALGINLTSQSLNISDALINSIQAPPHICSIRFSRKTTFTYDYHTIPSVPCDSGSISINSEPYKVYLLGKQPISATVPHNIDVCYGETVGTGANVLPITLNFPINTCQIPTSLFTTLPYTQTVQLYTITGTGSSAVKTYIGSPIVVNNSGTTVINPIFVAQAPIFQPNSSINNFIIGMKVTSTYQGCTTTRFIEDVFHLGIKPKAVGGKIMVDDICNPLNIISPVSDYHVSFNNQYTWQYSNDNINWITLNCINCNGSSIAISNIPVGNPRYIKRISNGFSECPNVSVADPASLPIIIPNNDVPIFNIVSPICKNSAAINLPAQSSNIGNPISGYWTLGTGTAAVTQINTSNSGVFNYYFHYSISVGGVSCPKTPILVPITINETKTPIFSFITSVCPNTTVPILPLISNNNIAGTWSPAIVSATTSADYIFTPTNGCNPNLTAHINVLPACGITLSWGSNIGCQIATGSDPVKPSVAIEDSACIKVCDNTTIIYTLTGNIGTIDHTVWNVTGGTIASIGTPNPTNTSIAVMWTTGTTASLQAMIYLIDWTHINVNKCIEKIKSPTAQFTLLPLPGSNTACVDTPVYFINQTLTNGGTDVVYYNWDFGDGTTSTEFQPSHIYSREGNYVVTLVAYTGCSCTSKIAIKIEINKGSVPISCPTVVCEGQKITYSIPESHEYGDCDIDWQVFGGTIVGPNGGRTIDIIWDQVDSSGFGSLLPHASCFECVSPIKIPVVLQNGTIVGNPKLCLNKQNVYKLPQWATTDFHWSINDNGTGATMVYNNQRNEIIIQARSISGNVDLYCNYQNTLLGCGGRAHFVITIQDSVVLNGPLEVCLSTNPTNYQIVDNTGSPITVNWFITGPNGFNLSGTGSNMDIVFPTIGTYYFDSNDPNYCNNPIAIHVAAGINPPIAIVGALKVCPDLAIAYSCIAPAGALTHWQIVAPGGIIVGSSTGNNVLIKFAIAPNFYTIKTWFTKGDCASTILTTIIEKDIPNLTITGDRTVCGSSFSTYTTVNSGADSYNWKIIPETAGSIESGQNTTSIKVLWNQNATFAKIELIERKCADTYNNNNIIAPGANYPITIISTPVINYVVPTTACTGIENPFTVSATIASGTIDRIEWDFGDLTTANTATATHYYNDPLTNSVTYQITATVWANGCLFPNVQHFSISVSPSPIVYLLPARNIVSIPCNNTTPYLFTINIQAGPFATTAIQWYKNGTAVGTNSVSNAIFDVAPFGAGTYYAIVTNSVGCSKQTSTIFVEVLTCPNGNGGTGGSGDSCLTPCLANTINTILTPACQGITATAVMSGTPSSWDFMPINIPSSNYTINTATKQLNIFGLEPGSYSFQLFVNYEINCGSLCGKRSGYNFLVPYKSDIKHRISCSSNGIGYNIQLLDHSIFYPTTPIENYEFTINGGATWYPATVTSSGVHQYLSTGPVMPGRYIFGIRISSAGYAPCITYETVVLPPMPSALFTFENNACANTAMQFHALDTTPGSQYLWDFGESTNLQPNPVKSFSAAGDKTITLTVTNRYGCSATYTARVNFLQNKMNGNLSATPPTTCLGNTATIIYTSVDPRFLDAPSLFEWHGYGNTGTVFPVVTTTVPRLTVTQSGHYFVYTQNTNGCWQYSKGPAAVTFVPPPAPPIIKGEAVLCTGSTAELSVLPDAGFRYSWTLNGVPQPAWNNLNNISSLLSTAGTYVFGVTATSTIANCSGTPAYFTVKVFDTPATPILKIESVNCMPYRVEVTVDNPNPAATYYWSNGQTGVTATMQHDGPIKVTAVIFGCSSTAQIVLPVDLNSLTWIFPKGCFTTCEKTTLGPVIGPLGQFENWEWIENGTPFQSGTASAVSPLTLPTATHQYSMYLRNEYCELTTGTMSVDLKECTDGCDFKFNIESVKCFTLPNGRNVYQLIVNMYNPSGSPIYPNFSIYGATGFLSPSTIIIPPSSGITQTFIYYPASPTTASGFVAHISVFFGEQNCEQDIKIGLPEESSCEETPTESECEYKFEINSVVCNRELGSASYQVQMSFHNPNRNTLSLHYSLPGLQGYFVPNTINLPPGSSTFNLTFYPSVGFTGGTILVNVDGVHGITTCKSKF